MLKSPLIFHGFHHQNHLIANPYPMIDIPKFAQHLPINPVSAIREMNSRIPPNTLVQPEESPLATILNNQPHRIAPSQSELPITQPQAVMPLLYSAQETPGRRANQCM